MVGANDDKLICFSRPVRPLGGGGGGGVCVTDGDGYGAIGLELRRYLNHAMKTVQEWVGCTLRTQISFMTVQKTGKAHQLVD